MVRMKFFKAILIAICINLNCSAVIPVWSDQPIQYNVENLDDIVDINQLNNRILVDLAYSTSNNFLHEDVYGDLQICYLRKAAAEKLDQAQNLLEKKRRGFRLIVYDGLRPRNIQYEMWHIVKGTAQQQYVADPEEGSIHNFGAAVDVSIVDEKGNLLDMGTSFDYFGDLAQPRYEKQFLKENRLSKNHVENRTLLRQVMEEAGFESIEDEWWHFNAFPPAEVKRRYEIVEFLLPLSKMKTILDEAGGLSRDNNGFCILVKGSEKKLYLIKNNSIKLMFDIGIGEHGLGKTKEGDHKTPLGDYTIKWMVSRNGPPKQNPGGLSSFVMDGKTYAVLDTELYFGNLASIRVHVSSDGTRTISQDPQDRPITPEEIEIAHSERLWTDAYGGDHVYVMALDYPNKQDKADGKTGSCIEIHASLNLEKDGYKNYTGSMGCVTMYPMHAKRIYEYVNPGTPVRIVE